MSRNTPRTDADEHKSTSAGVMDDKAPKLFTVRAYFLLHKGPQTLLAPWVVHYLIPELMKRVAVRISVHFALCTHQPDEGTTLSHSKYPIRR
jgi:hypothetical protein